LNLRRLVVALVVVAACGPAEGDDRTEPVRPHDGRFVVECEFSHSAPDDPIVHPGMSGMSHQHDFFGNTDVDADSTLATLAEGDTTCEVTDDLASYWAPALYDGERKIEPLSSDSYYRAAEGVHPEDVEPFPPGLMIVAGDPFSEDEQPSEVVGWACGNNPRRHPAPPDCGPGSPLRVRVTFPDCWNGDDVDSQDHRSHMAYSGADGCPTEHPVAVPQLEFVVQYPFSGDPSGLRLASGETFTAHADFFNAWEEDALAESIRLCLVRDVVCEVPTS
jgi:hypothetical protein